ncbi:FAD-dependent oxidoreductase [Streptomyces roseoverticillatus]|uniref:NAD(P)/FAD-dependent oxidoreductase n=1 Tax=Streptomyces roseoverticillatus TaxID=66429 RepID=UPI0033C33B16
MTRRIAVVGAGMAAARFAERFQALGGDAEVTLYGAEPRAPYNRVLLADVLTGRYAADDLALPAGDARLRTACEVTGLDTVAHTLRLADGEDVPYDELVLATGAEPVACGGLGRGRVHVVRTAADCEGLAAAAVHAQRVVVIGGGILGVDVARALAARTVLRAASSRAGRAESSSGRAGVSSPAVTIVHRAAHLNERHLDRQAGELLQRGLAGLGISVRTGTQVRALHGADRVTAVELTDGHVLDADLVVSACGVTPHTALARAAGLPVRTGVVVDDRLSCAPDVYAIGDCAEHRDRTHGTAGAAWEQADVLAARLSGAAPDAAYAGSRPYARLSAGPLEYAAFGDPAADEDGLDVLRIADATRGSYKKLVLRGDRIAGAILFGDLATVGALARACERDEIVPADPFHLLTSSTA